MNERDDILILTASAGGGHLVAARAMEAALRARAPQLRISVVDVLAIANPLFRRLYAGGYLALVRHLPAAMGWLYDTMDRPNPGLSDKLRIAIQDANKGPIVRTILRRRPRLIIHTHYLSAEIVAQMRRARRIDCPHVIVTTDYETHRIWAQQPAERYYTATEDGKFYLTTFGIAPEHILATGIPVRPGFVPAEDMAAARRECGLDPDIPVVLLLCGGFGVGPIVDLFGELLAVSAAAQIVVIVGRNEPLHRRLEAVARHHGRAGRPRAAVAPDLRVRRAGGVRLSHEPGAPATGPADAIEGSDALREPLASARGSSPAARSVRVIGFTDRVHDWMRAADVAVTKPGGLTVAEALACGLPLVIVNPIPGQETRNSDYVLERGAGVKVNSPRLLGRRVSELLADAARLTGLRTAARATGRPHAAADIARDALNLLGVTS